MNALELRNKLISLIKNADISSLKRIESLLFQNEDVEISDKHKSILDKRLELHQMNPNAGKSVKTAKENLAEKYGV